MHVQSVLKKLEPRFPETGCEMKSNMMKRSSYFPDLSYDRHVGLDKDENLMLGQIGRGNATRGIRQFVLEQVVIMQTDVMEKAKGPTPQICATTHSFKHAIRTRLFFGSCCANCLSRATCHEHGRGALSAVGKVQKSCEQKTMDKSPRKN